jgi:hypothetical protein
MIAKRDNGTDATKAIAARAREASDKALEAHKARVEAHKARVGRRRPARRDAANQQTAA